MNKEFDKIIKELKTKRDMIQHASIPKSAKNAAQVAYNTAIDEVKTVAEKHKTEAGWIPCSSGKLPEEYEDVEVTVEEIADDVGGKRYYTVRSWLQDGQWVIKKNLYHPTVIAWKYPAEPFQPKGK